MNLSSLPKQLKLLYKMKKTSTMPKFIHFAFLNLFFFIVIVVIKLVNNLQNP